MQLKKAILDPNAGRKPQETKPKEEQPQLNIPVLGFLSCRRSQQGQPNVALHYTGAKVQGSNNEFVAVPQEAFEAAETAFKAVLEANGLEQVDVFGTYIPYQGITYGPGGRTISPGNTRLMGTIKRVMQANGFQMQAADAATTAQAGNGDDPAPDAVI